MKQSDVLIIGAGASGAARRAARAVTGIDSTEAFI